MKQAEPEADELEQDIQASLSAALEDVEKLDFFAPGPRPPEPPRARKPKIPKGMPPLPHGRLIPPLPVSRVSVVPRLVQSLRPTPSVATATAGPRRWPGVVFALLTLTMLGAGWWWLQLR